MSLAAPRPFTGFPHLMQRRTYPRRRLSLLDPGDPETLEILETLESILLGARTRTRSPIIVAQPCGILGSIFNHPPGAFGIPLNAPVTQSTNCVA